MAKMRLRQQLPAARDPAFLYGRHRVELGRPVRQHHLW